MALDVSANNISGALPDQLVGGPAAELQYLYLSGNSLTGVHQVLLSLVNAIETCHHDLLDLCRFE